MGRLLSFNILLSLLFLLLGCNPKQEDHDIGSISLSSSSGPTTGGNSIVITGDGFEFIDGVTFGGLDCTGLSVTSKTSLTCTVPAHAAGSVTVNVYGRPNRSSTTTYTYVQTVPSVSSVSPTGGALAGGTTLTVTGSGFATGATVTVGGTTCTSPTVISSSTISCTTPAKAAGAYAVQVTNPDTFSGSLAGAYTYRAAPAITSLSSTVGSTAGGATVTITGTGFLSGVRVNFGFLACANSTPYVNATTLTCTTPAYPAGPVTVTVTNPDGQVVTSVGGYTYYTPPVISSISPTGGALAGGTSVTLTGTGFTNGATVSIGGTACTSVTYVSATSLICTTPVKGAGLYDMVVTNPSTVTGTLTSAYTYRAAPTVTSVSPSAGALAAGTSVTITGTGFVTGAQATFGGSLCTNLNVVNGTTITCKAPAHAAGAVAVAVTNNDNQSGNLAGAYTYQAAPTVTSVSPIGGPLAGGTLITITGTGFVAGATVQVGGAACTVPTVVSATSITCTTPAHAAGAVTVAVTNADTQSGNASNAFTYEAAPTVTSISPTAGSISGSTSMTITGTGFLTGATVDIGGSACGTVTVVSATSITCTTSAHVAGTVAVTVTNADTQSGNLAAAYTYQPAPTVTSVAPNGGPTSGSTAVTITGTGFLAGATVDVGGVACTGITVVNGTTITCTTPSHAGGAVNFTVTNSDSQSGTGNSVFTYRPPPTVTSVSPAGGNAAGGTAITITGTNFVTGATVDLGGSACTGVTVVSATSITCTTPAHAAGAVNVTVTNTDTQNGSAASAYTFLGAPTVTSVSPIGGLPAGGTSVTITGTNFFAGATVDFGGSACTSVSVVSATSITCTTPAHAAGAVTVTVTNIDTQNGNAAAAYTYEAAPTVTSAIRNAASPPTNGSYGPMAGGTVIDITGTGFLAGATVSVGSGSCTGVTVNSATSLTCTTPLSLVSGPASITVTNADTQHATLATGFIYLAAPTVTGVTPNAGPLAGGTSVTVTGTGFMNSATVDFGGSACTGVSVASSTSLTCTIPGPMPAGAVTVTVTNPDGQTGSKASGYTYQVAPTLTSISPAAGALAGGTAVTLTGTGFVTGATVKINSVSCTSVVVVNATTITCNTPAQAAGSYTVLVTNADGQSDSVAGLYTYQAAPTVTSVSPTAGALAGGTTITLTGTGFLNGASVTVGGSACTGVSVVNATTITCSTPAKSAGAYSITVTNADNQSGSLSNAYTYQAAPTLTSISPNAGALAGGTSVTLAGTNFRAGATVTIGGTACTGVTVVSSTSITCTTPAKAAATYAVVVTNTDTQTGTLGAAYTYQAAPTVTSVSPTVGPLAGGTVITITGTGFLSGATVTLSGTSCTGVTVVNATTITCTTVAKAAGGYSITVTNSDTQTGSGSTFTYQPAPSVTSVSPSRAPLAGGTAVTVTGSGFLAGATVDFGGSPCNGVTVVSATSITCTTTAHAAGAVTVTVTNTDTQNGATASAFTYQGPPTVTSVSPTSGPQAGGGTLTITGTGFYSGASVTVDGNTCTSVSVVSATSITCTIPSHAGAGAVDVNVINADAQTGTGSGIYTYTAVPVLAFQTGSGSPNPADPDSYGSTNTNVTHTFTLINSGEATTTAISLSVTGTNPAVWSFGTDNCTGQTLAPNATCTVQLTFLGAFMPTGSYSAVLNATATSGGTDTNAVSGSVP